MQQVAERAKVRARQAMEAADAVAEEERIAEQQYQLRACRLCFLITDNHA